MELEKWGIKEGWCWNDDKKEAKKCILIKEYKNNSTLKFCCKILNGDVLSCRNFSETDPNAEDLIVGEFAYFWDEGWLEGETVMIAKLAEINKGKVYRYIIKNGDAYQYCSHKNPLL
jgi:hypothetical protein